MPAIRNSLLCLFMVLAVVASTAALAAEPAKPAARPAAASKLSFGGAEYVHRWSQNGQNEFTPADQPDLNSWRDMVTIIVNERVSNGEQLAQLANGVVDNYTRAGEIIRTDSRPRTATAEAEHFIAAMLHGPGVTEAVFARVLMAEGRGMIVVYSHRAYGQHSQTAIGPWMDRNGPATERALMSWTGMPKVAQLRALPQSKSR
jgi:hypothetical protein